jgi:hypothetical protein
MFEQDTRSEICSNFLDADFGLPELEPTLDCRVFLLRSRRVSTPR